MPLQLQNGYSDAQPWSLQGVAGTYIHFRLYLQRGRHINYLSSNVSRFPPSESYGTP